MHPRTQLSSPTNATGNSVGTSSVELRDVTVEYPGVRALNHVSLALAPGEVHALLGENGAGKSTLIQSLSGVVTPDTGELWVGGERLGWGDPVIARERGIQTVHQEAELFGALSVAENIAFRQGWPRTRWGAIDWLAVGQRASQTVRLLPAALPVSQPADQLSIAQRQLSQIASAIVLRPRLLILDEPTSALSNREADWLFARIHDLRTAGAAILYVSHRQEEIFRLADRITVLRDGSLIWTRPTADVSADDLLRAMVGRISAEPPPTGLAGGVGERRSVRRAEVTEPALEVCDLVDIERGLQPISLRVARGEIVGLYGLVGAGRTRLARTIFGWHSAAGGHVSIGGHLQQINSPAAARSAGLAYLPEDRLRDGICRQRSIRENMVLATLHRYTWGLLSSRRAEQEATAGKITELDIRCRSTEQLIGQLSGGNQQKVVLGRWLLSDPKVLILDEPTRGVDVGAKAEIHRLIRRQAEERECGVLMISSDLTEVMEHSDRIYVMCAGQLVGEFPATGCSAEQVATAALPSEQPTGQQLNNQPSGAPQLSDRRLAGKQNRGPQVRTRPHWLPAEIGLVALTGMLAAAVWLAGWQTGGGLDVTNLLTHAAVWIVLGLAATQVIIVRGIDISVGSLLALSAGVAGMVTRQLVGWEWPDGVAIGAGFLAALTVGGSGGVINAGLSRLGQIHPIVVTLGTMTIYRGLVITLLGGRPLADLPPALSRWGVNPETGFRGVILWAAVATILSAIYLGQTLSGRRAYAYGANPVAARLAGISAARVWLTAFGLSGILVGLAGWMSLTLSGQMQAGLGRGWELGAISIAVIGGVSIEGGRGNVLGVVCAAILLRLINTVMVRWGVAEDQVELLVGIFMLAAVLTDLGWRRVR